MATEWLLRQNSELRREGTYNWTLPAWRGRLADGRAYNTCPSASACVKLCYARHGTYRFRNVLAAHERNLLMVLDDLPGWERRMAEELRHPRFYAAHVRVHDSGDCWSDDYLAAWLRIMRASPVTAFYAYTKEVALFRAMVEPDPPDNFHWVYSLGGAQDHLIDRDTERHADVFTDEAAMEAAGYSSQEDCDLLAVYGPPKVGIPVSLVGPQTLRPHPHGRPRAARAAGRLPLTLPPAPRSAARARGLPHAPLRSPVTRTVTFRGGLLPAEHARPHLKLSRLLAPELPAPPALIDWLASVPTGAWGMLGNDEWGDCTAAAVAHKRIGDVYVNQHGTLPVTTQQTLALYSAVTGFDPAVGPPGANPTDQGAVCQDVLNYWRKQGFLGEKILAFAKVDISNLNELKTAIALFGQVYCGMFVPSTAETQFNAGQTWDVVAGAPILGGHCVTLGAYDTAGLTAVTWGQLQKLTWRFFRKYFQEAWVVIGPDMIDPSSGRDAQGLDLTSLGADFGALTGEPNPVPPPAPEPPSPHPTPTPSADPRLVQALDLMQAWAADNGVS